MTKSKVYLEKIEKTRTLAATGFRIKKEMYNALRSCYKEGIEFPFRFLLEHYCIPGMKTYLTDKDYYLLKGEEFVVSERTVSEKELFLRHLAAHMGGKVGFTPDKDPVLVVDGYVLSASKLDGKNIADEPKEDYTLPYKMYPRIINIVENQVLIEQEDGVCEWMGVNEYVI